MNRAEPPSEEALEDTVFMLRNAEEACGTAAPEGASTAAADERRLVSVVRRGYETRLANMRADVDEEKARKAWDKAHAKFMKLQRDDWDEDMTAKARSAEERARRALDRAKMAAQARKAREVVAPRLSEVVEVFRRSEGAKEGAEEGAEGSPTLRVLHEEPMVVVIDGWLGEAGSRALDAAGELFRNGTARRPRPRFMPSALTDPDKRRTTSWLCLPVADAVDEPELADGPSARLRSVVEDTLGALSEGCPKPGDEPEDMLVGSDGSLDGAHSDCDAAKAVNLYMNGSALAYGAANNGCGPLSPALEDALFGATGVRSVFIDASRHEAIDALDAAVSAAAGMFRAPRDGELVAKALMDGVASRVDPSAAVPDDWDAEEDGEWFVAASFVSARRARFFHRRAVASMA